MLLRVALAPLLVALTAGAQRRWGHTAGGRLVGLPLTSGPIVVVLIAERGTTFAAQTSAAMLLGLISGCGFCLAYVITARRHRWAISLLTGLAVFATCTAILWWIHPPVLVSLAMVTVCLLAMLRWWPKGTVSHTAASAWWDMPLRMAWATAIVIAITGLADVLGPRLAGLIAPLQVIAATLAVFTHRAQGGAAVARFLRGVVQGSFSFAAFFLVLALALPRWGAAPSLLLACSVAINTQVLISMLSADGRVEPGRTGAATPARRRAAPAAFSHLPSQETEGKVLSQVLANQGRVSKEAG